MTRQVGLRTLGVSFATMALAGLLVKPPTSHVVRILLASVAAIMCRLAVQPLLPAEDNPLLPPSVIVESGWLPLAFFIYGVLVYGAIGAVFYWLNPVGQGIRRGLRFALVYVLMWVPLLLEPLPHAEYAQWTTMLGYPMADAMGLIVLGIGLGRLFPEATREKGYIRAPLSRSLVLLPLVWASVRIVSAATLPLYTWFDEQPVLTISWTVITGLCFGWIYWLVSAELSSKAQSPSVAFAFIFIGPNLLLFNGFLLLVARVDPIDLLARTLLDVAALFIGARLINWRSSTPV